MLRVEHLAKSFGGLHVLQDVDFDAAAGAVTALIGPNGAGKSTLVNLIGGVLRPDAGRVLLDGTDVTGLPSARMFDLGVARTFQVSGNVAQLNVFESVAVAAYRQARGYRAANAMARRELERFDLWRYRDERLGSVPSATLRLVDFARGMVSRPKVLLLDELMAGLTPHEVDVVVEQVRACRDEGVAIVMIEHVMQAVQALADHVVVLNQGRMIASGPLSEVSRDPEVISAYLGAPLGDGTPDAGPAPHPVAKGT
ncbi:ABC transporter ATP-binding protein [Pseudonocardia humida]|uniref:ABC transporter ATP-binding protein n=1 Tax=Pseudonocardia humida TaxID=2800819 RepID=A0ABT1A299_9PSEU|nr:ABC transporter ATP-binding protein [Pseudonocardia humida]MCO1657081.1 ABC transporter ATP-binding protein [Pseudonocardia humida]